MCTNGGIKKKQSSYAIKFCDISGTSLFLHLSTAHSVTSLFSNPGIQSTQHTHRKDRKSKQDAAREKPQVTKSFVLISDCSSLNLRF